MPTNYPTSLDAVTRPTAGQTLGGSAPTHAVHHDNAYDAIEALEAKLGIGASTAAANQVLRGTGAGASAFGQLQAGDVAAGALPVRLGTTGILGATLAAATFSSISGAYAHLEVRINGRSTVAATLEGVILRVNSDAGSNYWGETVYGAAASIGAAEHPVGSNHALIGYVPGATASSSGWFGAITVSLPGYAAATFHPLVTTAYWNTDTSAGASQVRLHGMVWAGATAAITRLDIQPASGLWEIGSIVSLYGWP